MDCTYSPVDFYYSSICHYCKESSKELKTCSFCKTFSFCCKQHVKNYWIYHKRLCKVIKESKQSINYKVGCTKEEFQSYKINLKNNWEQKLQRPLKPFEHQVWMFPKVCNVCFAGENLYTCSDCMVVFYCSKKCEEFDNPHKNCCKELNVCLYMDRLLFRNHSNNKTINLEIDEIENSLKQSNNISEFIFHLHLYFNQVHCDEHILKFEIIAPAATVIGALENTKKINNRLYFSPNMILHFAGADNYEMSFNWPLILELIFHYVKNVISIKIFLIGPELDYEIKHNEFPDYFCEICKSRNLTASIVPKRAFYHDIVNEIDKPDIIFALNNGLHEFQNVESDTWLPSIPFLLNQHAALVLTAYTKKELQMDMDRIINFKNNFKIILDIQENEFRSKRPLRNWDYENDPVFYNNYYITIISA